MKKKILLVIFDLDGVLINSKENMNTAWNAVKKKFNIKKKFSDYFKWIGYPFTEILDKLEIKNKQQEIKKCYYATSLKKINKIKPYKNVKKVLQYLKKKGIKMAIVTSKNKKRTVKIVKKMNFPINNIVCPSVLNKGKPYPDQMNIALKKAKINRNNVVYVGDMHVDYQFSKNARINFIFAEYGYGKNNKYKYNIKSINDLRKFIK